jgi:hypothetical protein
VSQKRFNRIIPGSARASRAAIGALANRRERSSLLRVNLHREGFATRASRTARESACAPQNNALRFLSLMLATQAFTNQCPKSPHRNA